ncbi:MAG: hypothetical protein Q6373_016595 [Candidatus Sigynarchaeota archaeon]
MTAGSSFETGRARWVVYGGSYGTSTAESIAGSLMGMVYLTYSSYPYYMTYTFASAGTYSAGVKIEFDMAAGATNALRTIYIGSDSSLTDYWYISFSTTGYIVAGHDNSADVALTTYIANARYHVTLEFVGNMHTIDVTINGTKYNNGGVHFSTRYGTATAMQVLRVHTGASSAGWIAIDNIDASWYSNIYPILTHPSDITYTAGQTGYQVSWTMTDINSSIRTYTVYANGSVVTSGTWSVIATVTQSVAGLPVGSYNYTIVTTDGYGGFVQDTVIVRVLNGIPTITHPNDAIFTGDQSNIAISWTITDFSTSTRTYKIYANGSFIASGTWNTGKAVTVNLDSIAPGKYNITIVASDGIGACVQDQVWITIYAGQPMNPNQLRDAGTNITLVILGIIGASLVFMLVVGPILCSKRGIGKSTRYPDNFSKNIS